MVKNSDHSKTTDQASEITHEIDSDLDAVEGQSGVYNYVFMSRRPDRPGMVKAEILGKHEYVNRVRKLERDRRIATEDLLGRSDPKYQQRLDAYREASAAKQVIYKELKRLNSRRAYCKKKKLEIPDNTEELADYTQAGKLVRETYASKKKLSKAAYKQLAGVRRCVLAVSGFTDELAAVEEVLDAPERAKFLAARPYVVSQEFPTLEAYLAAEYKPVRLATLKKMPWNVRQAEILEDYGVDGGECFAYKEKRRINTEERRCYASTGVEANASLAVIRKGAPPQELQWRNRGYVSIQLKNTTFADLRRGTIPGKRLALDISDDHQERLRIQQLDRDSRRGSISVSRAAPHNNQAFHPKTNLARIPRGELQIGCSMWLQSRPRDEKKELERDYGRVNFTIELDRYIPDDTQITVAHLHYDGTGSTERWSLRLVCMFPDGRSQPVGRGTVGVQINTPSMWDKDAGDYVRLMCWQPLDYEHGKLLQDIPLILDDQWDNSSNTLPPAGEFGLSRRTLDRFRFYDVLKGEADLAFDAIVDQLKNFLTGGVAIPGWLKDATENLTHWRKHARLVALIRLWDPELIDRKRGRWTKASWEYEQDVQRELTAFFAYRGPRPEGGRFIGDNQITNALSAWRHTSTRRHRIAYNTLRKVTAYRNEVYRRVANALSDRYGKIRMVVTDWRDRKVNQEFDRGISREHEQAVHRKSKDIAPGIFQSYLAEEFGGLRTEWIDGTDITKTCPVCGGKQVVAGTDMVNTSVCIPCIEQVGLRTATCDTDWLVADNICQRDPDKWKPKKKKAVDEELELEDDSVLRAG